MFTLLTFYLLVALQFFHYAYQLLLTFFSIKFLYFVLIRPWRGLELSRTEKVQMNLFSHS